MQMPALRGDESVFGGAAGRKGLVQRRNLYLAGRSHRTAGPDLFHPWLVLIMVSGPVSGTRKCGRGVLEMLTDIARISPRRVLRWPGWRGANRFAAV